LGAGAQPSTPGGAADADAGSDGILDRALATVPGFVSKGELEILRRLAAEARGTIVELGPFAGLSTIALCSGAQESGAEVVAIDAFISWMQEAGTDEATMRQTLAVMGFAPQNIDAMCNPSAEALKRNLSAFGFAPRVVESITWEATDAVSGVVSLLFVDADHTKQGVERDIEAWAPKMAPDGVVAFHDYHSERWPDVKPLADAWAERDGWYPAERDFRMQVFRRARPGAAAQG
jgi:hypothetical protein